MTQRHSDSAQYHPLYSNTHTMIGVALHSNLLTCPGHLDVLCNWSGVQIARSSKVYSAGKDSAPVLNNSSSSSRISSTGTWMVHQYKLSTTGLEQHHKFAQIPILLEEFLKKSAKIREQKLFANAHGTKHSNICRSVGMQTRPNLTLEITSFWCNALSEENAGHKRRSFL
jgi:hypothetical protein